MSDITHPPLPAATDPTHYVRRPGDEPPVQEAPIRAKRRPQYGQIVTGFVAIALLVLFIQSQALNPNMEWSVTREYMFNPVVLQGVGVTIQLAIFAMLISIVLAFAIALMIQSNNKVVSVIGRAYVWFFRGVPMLVQVLLWFNLAVLFPVILGQDTNTLISGFTAGLIALSLAESGYMAEIIRGGIISVPTGQTDAGVSIGLTRNQALARIVLPQSIRVIIPPTGNQFIGMLKATSLVSVIGGSDLLTRVQLIYGQNFKILPLLIVGVLWYLILVTIAGTGQHFLERRFNASQPGPRRARKSTGPATSTITTTTTGGAL
ncbi:amino acid ABC transporter permease [Arthrobacter sp. CJ23]|uniref:amino acid ABC transporter permease n=1 Tax=Arthrobacter sp. CJ23 TaxID=2972479 RepID=UPI00215CE12B|nr:amino acid ABC transporter permease [Arthrobacter sp. CJ23]UVJ39157.1 amino acid ABC transporter permease [Arthrobacter sp. CJ23]